MGPRPSARRALLLGAGCGVVLTVLESAAPRGWWGGVLTLVHLLPVALAVVVGGPLAGAVATGIAMAAAAGIEAEGGAAALVIALKYGAPGAVLGAGLARRQSLIVTAVATAGVALVSLFALLWLLAPAGLAPLAYLERQLAAHAAEFESWPARIGGAGEGGAWAAEAARFVVSTLRLAGPGMVGLGVFAGVVANYVLARLCLRGLDGFRPFAAEAVPDHVVWAVIVAGGLVASGRPAPEALGLNLLLVLMPLYAIQGLAVFRHFFQRIGVPRILQAVSFGLFALQPVLLVAVSCIGLSDLWIDFRKIRQAPTAASG